MKQRRLFDSHFHIIDFQYPLVENAGYLPGTFTCEDYLQRTAAYDLRGGALVSGSFQGFDQGYLIAGLRALGDRFVGVTQLPFHTTDEEILALNEAGVRALRFNLRRGGSESVDRLTDFALRVWGLAGWHVELYSDAADLEGLFEALCALPKVCIDHLGLSRQGLPVLCRLAERGIRVKASGFGRLDFDVAEALRALYAIDSQCLMFGTDLPSTRAPRAYSDDDYDHVAAVLGECGAVDVCYRNGLRFYDLPNH